MVKIWIERAITDFTMRWNIRIDKKLGFGKCSLRENDVGDEDGVFGKR